MKICPNCNKEFSDNIKFCTHCGCELNEEIHDTYKGEEKKPFKWSWVLIIGICVFLVVAVFCYFSRTRSSENTEPETPEVIEEEHDVTEDFTSEPEIDYEQIKREIKYYLDKYVLSDGEYYYIFEENGKGRILSTAFPGKERIKPFYNSGTEISFDYKIVDSQVQIITNQKVQMILNYEDKGTFLSEEGIAAYSYLNGKEFYSEWANAAHNPNDNITRAEFAQVLSNIGCKYVFESGEVSGDFDGNVFIGSNDVTLSGTVKGNVILGDGVDKTVLKDVKVTGDVISRGKDVEFNNAQVDGNLVITGSGEIPEIKTDDNTKLGGVKADKNYSSEKELENVSGNGKNVHGKTETPADTKKNTHGSHHGGGSSSSTTAKGTEIDVDGAKYYYSTKAAMTVGGKTVTGEQIGDTGVYLYTTAKDKDVYGVANVPYADFYYAELGNEVTESSDIAAVSKSSDKASSLREEHVYDAVTSATNKKSKKYGTTYITEGSGTTVYINGVKTAVKINSKLYAAAKAVAASKVTTANKLAEIADSIATVSVSLPEEYKTYKTVNADGTLTALTAAEGAGAVDSASTEATITSTSPWGNYQIDFKNMPSDIDTKTNVLGVVLETSEGQKVALRHNENIYSKKEDIAFVVDDSFTEPHGNVLYGKRFKSLSGKTITKITYLLSNKQSMTLNVNLRCAAQVPADNKVTVKSQTKYVLGQGATVILDTSKLLFKDTAEVSVKMGRKKVLSSDKYLYDASTGELKINGNGGTGAGEYTVVFHDTKEATTGYADTKVSFTLESDVAYDDTTKSVSNYASVNVASISAQKNVDKEKQAPAAVTDNGIINDNGFVDFSNKAFEGMKAKDSYKVTVTTTEGDSFSFNVTIPEKIYAYVSFNFHDELICGLGYKDSYTVVLYVVPTSKGKEISYGAELGHSYTKTNIQVSGSLSYTLPNVFGGQITFTPVKSELCWNTGSAPQGFVPN